MSKCKQPSECIDSNSCALMHECARNGPRLSERVHVGSTVYEKGTRAELAIDAIKRALLAAHSQAQAAEAVPDAAQNFACFLIDRCEGETITEESVLSWLGKFVSEPRYNPPASPVASNEREGLTEKQLFDLYYDAAHDTLDGWKLKVQRALLSARTGEGA